MFPFRDRLIEFQLFVKPATSVLLLIKITFVGYCQIQFTLKLLQYLNCGDRPMPDSGQPGHKDKTTRVTHTRRLTLSGSGSSEELVLLRNTQPCMRVQRERHEGILIDNGSLRRGESEGLLLLLSLLLLLLLLLVNLSDLLLQRCRKRLLVLTRTGHTAGQRVGIGDLLLQGSCEEV
jgi:hypothetical protein